MAGFKNRGLILNILTDDPGVPDENHVLLYSKETAIYVMDASGGITQVGEGASQEGGVASINGSEGVITINGIGVDVITDGTTITISGGGSGGGSSTPTTEYVSGNTFTPSGLIDVHSYVLTSNTTLNCPTTAMPDGNTIIIRTRQDGSGNRTLTFSDANGFSWKFSNGNIPTLSTAAYAEDILTVIRIENGMYVTIIKNFV